MYNDQGKNTFSRQQLVIAHILGTCKDTVS